MDVDIENDSPPLQQKDPQTGSGVQGAVNSKKKSVHNSKGQVQPVYEEDDDDVMIMEEENPGDISNEDKLCMIKRKIDIAKGLSHQRQHDIASLTTAIENARMNVEENVSESLGILSDNPKCEVILPVDRDTLELMIDQLIESVATDNLCDLTKDEYEIENAKLNAIEKSNQSVSKLFLDCHSRLKEFRQNLIDETADIEREIAEYKKRIPQGCLLIDSDEEDENEVTVLGPSVTSVSTKLKPQQSSLSGSEAAVQLKGKIPMSPQRQQYSNQSPSSQGLVNSVTPPMPSMEQLRSQFASAVNKSMPALISSLQNQQASQGSPSSELTQQTKAVPAQPIRWPELKVQDKVLGKKFNDVWYAGTILDIYPAAQKMEWKCKVKFDGKGMKILPGKHVAYREPINCFIRVGTRVVALYREDDAPNTFFAGVIAEAPSFKNNRRFLVFFDDGYAQYCEAKELHKVYMQSQNVWEDINPDTSAFIKEYLRIYPERPMVRLSKGQVVRTEWNGKWWTSKVQETDASLVKMYFQADKRIEWIYRGSTRLEPLFKALANADAIKAAGSAKGRRHNLTMRPSDALKKPSVEYTRGASEEDQQQQSSAAQVSRAKLNVKSVDVQKKKVNVAKKSTGGGSQLPASGDSNNATRSTSHWEAPWIPYQRKAAPGTQKPRNIDSSGNVDSPSQNSDKGSTKAPTDKVPTESKSAKDIASVLQERLASTSSEVEYDEEKATGERREITLDSKDRVHQPYICHLCDVSCVKTRADDRGKFRGRSPLLVPVLCGWERQICKSRPSSRRHVVYRAPCGRRLRSIEEVDKYLLTTDSNLTIDLFSFDQQLHVTTEFVPIKTFCDIKDLSYGKENYPISCVNGIDRHYPDYVEYSVQRIPTKGVDLNLDPDFLACCDCTDNCRDRSKCLCQQMTVQNTSWTGEVDPEAGYHHRRLPEPLFTGIIECNSRCKCDKRCSNRVAQQGLNMRLQVFKTEKKGWGLRCLDDIAKGSFICIYAGQLLTDKNANEDGKQYGDEYLAELDFMEVVERQKEGYESDVEDMSLSEDESDANYKESENDSDYTQDGSPTIGETRRSLRKAKIRQSDGVQSGNEEQETAAQKPEQQRQPPASTNEAQPIDISDDEPGEDSCEKDEDMSTKKDGDGPVTGSVTEAQSAVSKDKSKPRAKKSTGGSRFNLSSSFKMSQEPISDRDKTTDKKERAPTRSFFKDDTECYIMDAKSMGNLGRYLNHSCNPNVFVQNIFVDSHDLRFPWVSFFAGQYIRAGTELTWDYNYEVGSVPDKVLYCYCGSSVCRGRLL